MAFLIILPVLLFSAIIHECAHGWTAEKLGDPTARDAGRITLNPLPHIDPMGSIIVPLILLLASGGRFAFAWAKPVPVNFYNLRNPKRDMVWVSFSGPASNFFLVLICTLLFRVSIFRIGLGPLLGWGIFINLILGIFNLLPIPPLDGSKILMGILPREMAYSYSRLEPYGSIILIAFIVLGLFGSLVNLIVIPLFYFLTGSLPYF